MKQGVGLLLALQIGIGTFKVSFATQPVQLLPPEQGYIQTLQKKRQQTGAESRQKDPTTLPPVANFIEKLEAHKPNLVGGVAVLLHKGKVVYKTAFGHEKSGSGKAITTHTLFPLASLSKPVAAVAVALLVEAGRLNFKERFAFPYLKYPVSLRHILGHTTGYGFSGNTHIEQGIERSKLLQKVSLQKPQGQAGLYYYYSNTMFSLLEEALQAKKMSLASLLQALKKSLQTSEIAIAPENTGKPVAYPHLSEKVDEQICFKSLPLPSLFEKATPSSAGIFASLEAMIKFFRLSFGYEKGLITPKTLDKLYRIGITNRDMDKWKINWPCPTHKIQSYYGLGWRILKAEDQPGKDLIFHSGYLAGVATYIGFMPANEIGLILLMNQQSLIPLEWGVQLWGDFFEETQQAVTNNS
jgi:beta-lactamase class C